MVSADGKIVSQLLNVPADTEYWLIGWDSAYIMNYMPFISKAEAESFLPGGLKLIGKFFASGANRDFLELSRELNLTPAIFLTRVEDKILVNIAEPPLLSQKEMSIKNPPSMITLYSKSIIPIFSLENPNCWFISRNVMYNVNGQIFTTGESPTWNSLGIKGKFFISLDLLYEITSDVEDFAPTVEIKPIDRSYSVQISWCTSVIDSIQFTDALDFHLQKLKETINYIVQSLKKIPTKSASSYCFSSDYLKHPINVTYFYDVWNEESVELENARKRVHELFKLPEDWPIIRSACSIKDTEGFKDVHVSLMDPKPSDVGVKYGVRGHYAYYHYAQDGFDDKGWGCAYRSLQTLISWLREQNFFHNEVPSHYQVQKLLVEAGDKPKEFIGSKEWIGAYEVMLILDTYCKVSCKILNLSSGSEFSSKGRELANHFTTEGSPIMIGGGVLAYTLLGVDYNEDTGDCRYLILDPHYVGADNIQTILQKGWCGWKGPDIFRNDCFYNLCMPQRPKYI